jgi:hypothetical protein
MLKILIIAISLSFASEHSVETYVNESVMTVPQDVMTFAEGSIEIMDGLNNSPIIGFCKAWQPKEVRLSQRGENNTKIQAR